MIKFLNSKYHNNIAIAITILLCYRLLSW